MSRSIQSPDLIATDVKYLANCTVETLEKIRNDRDFDLLWNDLNEKADSLDLREPKQPRKRKVPQKLLENDAARTTYHEAIDVKTYHRRIYFNAMDAVINAVKNRGLISLGTTTMKTLNDCFYMQYMGNVQNLG